MICDVMRALTNAINAFPYKMLSHKGVIHTSTSKTTHKRAKMTRGNVIFFL